MRGHTVDPGVVAAKEAVARGRRRTRQFFAGLTMARVLALGATLVLMASFLLVLRDIVDAVGDPSSMWPVVAVPLLAATALSRVLRVRVAVGLASLLLVGGLGLYLSSLPHDPQLLEIVESNVELLTGQSILRIEQADVWALVVSPTPVFVTWYLALRRWYGAAALVSGSLLFYLVLTGDAGTTVTVLGVVGGAATVGFGDLDRWHGSWGTTEYVAAVLAVMVVVPLLVTIVPGGAATPVTFLGGGGSSTIEGNVVDSDTQLEVLGSIEQSPQVRFTVEADRARYWRTGSFDRYTGDSWIRSEGKTQYSGGRLATPTGRSVALHQEVTVESELQVLPAAWRPMEVGDRVADRTVVTEASGLQLDGSLQPGEQYTVRSAVPSASTDDLAAADTQYPAHIERRYTQLPGQTPDRVAARTDRLTQDASNPYEQAAVIEQYLESNREYSLDVERPDGDIADAFLFEMESGYCTYYATTMVTMLRTQGVPARLAVGYTPGQQVAEDRHVVRGLNSHAWVEVYFPDVGWVQFDPTPSGPRQQTEQRALDQARENNVTNVDTPETEDNDFTPEEETNEDTEVTTRNNLSSDELQTFPELTTDTEPDGFQMPELPPRDQMALGAVVLVGAVAGIRRSGLFARLKRSIRVRIQRRSGPRRDIEQAHKRLLVLLQREARPRRTGEPMREYLDAIDASQDARRVAEIRERARYADDVSPERADEAVELVDRIKQRRAFNVRPKNQSR